MAYKFSAKSEEILNTVELKLNILAHRVLVTSPIDFAITEGYRTPERQKELFELGKSRTLESKHCIRKAIDFVPFINGKADFEAINEACLIAGLFLGIAKNLEIDLRVGALWNFDSLKNNTFVDVWHIELL